MSMEDLYQEVILDHFKNPKNKGALEASDARSAVYNPLCGDRVEMYLKWNGDTVQDLRFSGHGCSISQASASIVSSLCIGKTKDEIINLALRFKQMIRGEKDGESLPELGDAVALEGVGKFSARVRCAMLAWEALENCINREL